MKQVLSTILLSFAIATWAQTPTDLPKTLPELATILPQYVRTHPKPLDIGPFGDAFEAALVKDPNSVAAAIPILSQDLQDPDQDVQFYTLATLQRLAMQPNAAQLLSPVSAQLANAIASGGNQYIQSIALMTVTDLRTDAPDIVISPIKKLLVSRTSSDRVILGAAETLMVTRPADEAAQTAVLTVINDPATTKGLRQQLIYATANPLVGHLIVDNIVQVANTADDKELRDSAIAAALQVGPSALSGIGNRLNQIINDPSESLSSRRLARQALNPTEP